METDDLLIALQACVPILGVLAIAYMSVRQRRVARETSRILRQLDRTVTRLRKEKQVVIPLGKVRRRTNPSDAEPGLN
jgi:hypothetical protein